MKTKIFKKSNIEIQFNWIFVLIIGGIILFFFGSLIYHQKASSESKITHEILSQVDAVFSGSVASQNTLQKIRTTNVKFRFVYPDYFIGNQRKNLKGRFIFAPSMLEGDFISAWTKTWNTGFDVVNFLYITNPTIKYVFVFDSDSFAQGIYDSIDTKTSDDDFDIIRKEKIAMSDKPSNKGYKKIRFIFFSDVTDSVISEMLDKFDNDVTALKVEGDLQSGLLTFYRKSSNSFVETGKSPYLGEELLYGAIFVDNKESYDYLLDKAMERLAITSKIYEKRSLSLNQDVDPDSNCVYASTLFEDISNLAQNKTDYVTSVNNIATLIPFVEEQFINLQNQGCPSMY